MNRRFLTLVISLIAGGAAVWGLMRWYAEKEEFFPQHLEREIIQKRRELGQTNSDQVPEIPMAPINLSQNVRLAIGALGMPDEKQDRELADLALADLNGAQGLALVDRQSLDKVLRELAMSLSGLVRAKDALRVGKLLHADWFLLGSAAAVSGTNSLVVRVVDARTGIMRDGAVFVRGTDLPRLTANLAEFLRHSRRDAALSRPRVYLALGAFEDLSVNNRQASLPAQLRAYLTAAYQGAQVTLLERDYVSLLLHEANLDLAGLTDQPLPNGPLPMQAAFWLVEGSYQSYETSNYQVELELSVRRMLGRTKRVPLREEAGEPLFRKVKQTIDTAFDDKALVLVPTRVTELRAQVAAGRELAHFGMGGVVWIGSYNEVGPAAAVRERRNNEEAIRCFQTALLLDPGNREAKMCLAACFRHPTIRRIDQAREFYRQIIEEPIDDLWSQQARQALLDTFMFEGAGSRLEWFESAANQDASAAAVAFYRQVAQKAREDAIIAEGNSPKAQQLAESRLFAAMKKWDRDMSNGMYMVDFQNTGLGAFVESFGTNQAGAASRLVELLPRLAENTPQLAPHILAGVVSYQLDTNAPVIADFKRAFAQIDEHPEQVSRPAYYAALLSGPLYYWCRDHGLYDLGAKLVAYRMKAARKGKADPLDAERKMALAFAYLADQHWQEALEVFQTWSNRPVFMENRGLWGPAFTAVATAKQAAYCQQKLGLPVTKDPAEIDLGKSCLCLHPAGAFSADESGLWITVAGNLMRLDLNFQTNLNLKLPIDSSTPVNGIAVTPSQVWIATAGAGLIQFDKGSAQFHHCTEADGLLMNFVSQVLPASEEALWLAYGSDIGGGLGQLDWRTWKCSSFSRSLFNDDTPAGGNAATTLGSGALPPRKAVSNVCIGSGDEVWFVEAGRLRRFRRPDQWESFSQVGYCRAVALNGGKLFAGSYLMLHALDENDSGLLGLSVLDVKNGQFRQLPALYGLPHQMVSAVALHGDSVWLGGMGFVARVDPEKNKLLNYAYINARAVDQIQVAGGFLWVQFGRHLYRTSERDVNL